MITDPASHHGTPFTQGSHCNNVLRAFATPATNHQHSLNAEGISKRIAHHANVVISNDDTFLPDVGAHVDVDQ